MKIPDLLTSIFLYTKKKNVNFGIIGSGFNDS